MRVRRRPWYKKKAATGLDATLFFFVLAGGAVTIFLFKQADYSQVIVTAIPCSLLLFYAAIVRFVPYYRLREDQAGDNCYYLGFLFTLFSLSLALAAFVEAGGTEEIVEDFGIALASTILGLTLRVAFNQMRQDPVEIEHEVRHELASAAQRLRSELDQSVLEMNSFRRSTQQSISDGLEELNAKVGAVLEENLVRYDKVTSESAKRIDQTLTDFSENAQRLNKVAGQTVVAVETLRKRIDAIKAPEDLVVQKLVPAAGAVAEMVGEMKRRTKDESMAFHELQELIQGATAATAGLGDRMTVITEMLDGLKNLNNTLDITGRRIDDLATGFDKAGKAIVTTGDELRELGSALPSVARHADALGDIETQLSKLARTLEEQIEGQIDLLKQLREESLSSRDFFGLWRRR